MDESKVLDARFKQALEEDIAAAWLQGRLSLTKWVDIDEGEDPEQIAADYAKHVVRGNDA